MIISRKIDVFACLVFLLYFTGESIHSIWVEIGFNSSYSDLFYWINKSLFGFLSTLALSLYVTHKQTKIIVRGGSFFMLFLGVFQCLTVLNYLTNPYIWIITCPLFVIFILITSKICRQQVT